MGRALEHRVIQDVNLDWRLIRSGDILLARRMDGMDPFYMVASGAQAAHASVLLWRDGLLYVCEA